MYILNYCNFIISILIKIVALPDLLYSRIIACSKDDWDLWFIRRLLLLYFSYLYFKLIINWFWTPSLFGKKLAIDFLMHKIDIAFIGGKGKGES